MFTAQNFREMWEALDVDEAKQIAEAAQRIRANTADARDALVLLWNKFNEGDPLPVNVDGPAALVSLMEAEQARRQTADAAEAISLPEGIRRAIQSFSKPFTTGDIIAFLAVNYPELRAAERRVQISSTVSKMVAADKPKIEIVRRGEQGMPHTYARVNGTMTAGSRN